MKFSYYPGCTLHSTAVEYDTSTKAVCRVLGIELVPIPGWACCGATSAHSVNELLAYALPAHTINNADQPAIIAPCAACYNRLRYTDYALNGNVELRRRVEEVLGKPYKTGVAIRHLLDVIANDISIADIKNLVKTPLTGLRVVCYYGCLLTRPRAVAAFDDMEEPRAMDRLMAACGAEVSDWPHRTLCCGAAFSLSRTDIVYRMTGKILAAAARAGADAVVVACPMCQSNLDLRQKKIRHDIKLPREIPCVYFTQLLGLAFNIPVKELAFDKLLVNPSTIIKKIVPSV